jgi:hypothetical protein
MSAAMTSGTQKEPEFAILIPSAMAEAAVFSRALSYM